MPEDTENSKYLEMAKAAFVHSTSYMDANYRNKWAANLKHFQSKHAPGSKYLKDSYKYRSKTFRPKTRASVRNNEAAASAAFFANDEVVKITAEHPEDETQQASAEINNALLQHRLTKTIPWFLTLVGGFQDAQVMGAVASHQYWNYKEKRKKVKEHQLDDFGEPLYDEAGEPVVKTKVQVTVLKDEPVVDIIPLENIRFDPACDWRDIVGSSPYLIHKIPMRVMDVMENMENMDPKTGGPTWYKKKTEEIAAARTDHQDETEAVREQNRQYNKDPQPTPIGDYDTVWVHRNIFKIHGEDYIFYTLGTECLLSEPVKLKEEYFHGERPYVIGTCVVETHKVLPDSPVEMGESVQKELNEVANSRLDNVKLVLNKRYLVKRGSQVDLRSLLRNVAGGVTQVNDVDKDVKPIEFHDVTSSSYQEQNMLNLDFDEIMGDFSSSSIQSNRRMNETVGGMAMLRGSSNALTEYLVRVFAVTWVEKVLDQLVKLEQKYENDATIISIAASQAKLYKRYGIDEVTDELLNQSLTTKVNVGMNATDPVGRLEKLMLGLSSLAKITATPIPGLKMNEIEKEIFSTLGFPNAERFIDSQDDDESMAMQQQLQMLQQQIQELTKQVQDKQTDQAVKLKTTEMKEENKLQTTLIKEQGDNKRKQMEIAARLLEKQYDTVKEARGGNGDGRGARG